MSPVSLLKVILSCLSVSIRLSQRWKYEDGMHKENEENYVLNLNSL